jgi:biotin carboxylase
VRYLVLNRHPLAIRDYPAWLGPDHRATLITDAAAVADDPAVRAAQLAGYDHVEIVDEYLFRPSVEQLALQLHRKLGFERVIGLAEFDIIRAARLRAMLDLPGQGPDSALAFRDKVVMKDHLSRAGVPVPAYRAVSDLADLHAFIADTGYPIVVKPRRGGGSADVRVLRDEDDLRAYLGTAVRLGHDDGASLLAEAYVEHVLHHIDGIYVDGTCRLIWPSTHGATGGLDPMRGNAWTSVLLDPADPVFAPMVELVRRAIAALPVPGTFLFHAEVFRTADGLVFNEIGSRMGGAMIEPAMLLAFGLRMPEVYVRHLAGNDPPPIPAAPLTAAGWATLPPRPGRLVSLPATCPVEGVAEYRVYARPGTLLHRAEVSPDKIASLLAAGTDRADVQRVLDTAVDWFEGQLDIEPE